MSKKIKLQFSEDLDENGYYFVHYQSRSASIPKEIKSNRELLEELAARIQVNRNENWTITIEKRNDWERIEKEELARLKHKYEEVTPTTESENS